MLLLKLRVAVSFLLRGLWTAAVLVVVFERVLCQSEACAGSANCIRPVPVKESDSGSLRSLWLEMRCFLGCVDQYDGSLSVMNGETQWPTVDFSAFESDCTRYQKVRECKEGCLQRERDQTSTVNRCRDNCYTSCLEEQSCQDGPSCARSYQQSTCQRSCRKTYCRFGCEVYNLIHGSTSDSLVRHPLQSSLPPSVNIPAPQGLGVTTNWLYAVDTQAALLASARNRSQPNPERVAYSTVAFIVKVMTANNEDHYYWQKNFMQPLDLSPHACSAVSISFSVISKYSFPGGQVPEFSPEGPVCVPGVGGYPDQLSASSIRVLYTEDLREQFLGYAIARVSWNKPNNAQFLTSYTIRVYPAEVRCGGTTAVIHTFRNIDKELTNFTLQATDDSGLWSFGCTYLIEVVSLPTEMPINTIRGAYVASSTDLTEAFPPFELNCSRVWDERGQFSISVSWSFPNSTQLSHIRRFIVVPKLTVKANGRFLALYEQVSSYVANGRTRFSATTQKLSPLLDGGDKSYLVEVKAEKSNQYTWRRIPRTQSCVVLATPLPPRNITEVSVTEVEYDSSNQTLQLVVNIFPSHKTHGTLEVYEVVLRRSIIDCLECGAAEYLRFSSDSSTVQVHAVVGANESGHCVFLNARVFNNYNLSSHWSEVQVVALDEECDSSLFESTGGDETRVSVYYKGEGSESSSKVLEFGCGSVLPSNFITTESLDTRLQAISEKLEDITAIYQSGESEDERNTHFEMKLQSMEEKLDRILETLTRQGT